MSDRRLRADQRATPVTFCRICAGVRRHHVQHPAAAGGGQRAALRGRRGDLRGGEEDHRGLRGGDRAQQAGDRAAAAAAAGGLTAPDKAGETRRCVIYRHAPVLTSTRQV